MQVAPSRRPDPDYPGPSSARPAARRITPSASVTSHPRLVLLPILVLLVPSLLFAFVRQPEFKAEARLLVGGFDVEATAVPGFVEASRVLAETYGRLVSTPAVGELVAEQLGVRLAEVTGHIDGSSVPESSLIKVEGTASSEAQAMRYAAAAAAALQEYATEVSAGGSAAEALDQYREAATKHNEAEARLTRLTAAFRSREAAGVVTDEDRAALYAAQADVDRAALETDTLAQRYRDERSRRGASRMDVVAPATPAGNDRRTIVQLAIAGSLLLGGIAGVALATLVANRQQR